MKRFINRIIKWFSEKDWEDKLAFIIGGILGLILGTLTFVFIDKVPATPSDYAPMEKIMEKIHEDPDFLFKSNCSIDVQDGIITVSFNNDECQMIVSYNQNFDIISEKKVDMSLPWYIALLISLCVFAASLTPIITTIICLIIILFEIIWEFIVNIFHKLLK